MSGLLDRIARACARHHWRTFSAWLGVVVVAVLLAGSVGGSSVDNFRLPGSDAQRGIDVLTHNFPSESGSSAYLVFRSREGTLTDAGERADVGAALARASRLDHVVGVSDPYANGGVSDDGTIGLAEVRYNERSNELGRSAYTDLSDAVRASRTPGLRIEIGGPLAVWEQAGGSTEWLGVLAAMVVLTLVFGSLLAMLLPIGMAVIAVGVGQILVTVLAGVMDVPSSTPQLVLMIALGVALDYSLFVVNRFLDRVRAGVAPDVAAGQAAGTAGVAVLFAGCTVMVAISALFLSGVWAIGVMGFAVALAVAVAVAAALTLLPGMLGLLGRHANVSRVRLLRRSTAHEYRGARRWANAVVRRPVLAATGALVILVVLASPVLALRLGQADAGTQPSATSQRRAFDLLAQGFGPGYNGPLLVVADGPSVQTPASLRDLSAAIGRDPDVAGVSAPRLNQGRTVTVLEVYPRTSPHADATTALVQRLRDHVVPTHSPPGVRVLITGQTAASVDLADQMQSRLPLLIAAVVGVSFLLLMVGFRSIVVPFKAAIMNLLSIGVGYGVMVAVFQWGWGKGLIGLTETVPIVSWVPLLMFAILFGLSMDYEVFLISAIRGTYHRHHDNQRAVVEGLSSTARVITGAAAIMLVVFGSFVAFPDPVVKMTGLGLAVAILVDATIVRMALVPAAMVLLGDANWWLPKWLDRILPTVDFEGEDVETAEPGVVPAPTPDALDERGEREPVSVTR
jgi:RND superfamily putative drug exporter